MALKDNYEIDVRSDVVDNDGVVRIEISGHTWLLDPTDAKDLAKQLVACANTAAALNNLKPR